MATRTEYCFPSADGIHNVHAVRWSPENASPKAIVQIVHGIGEHTDRYEETAEALTAAGFAVACIDILGHGLTGANSDDAGYFADRKGWETVCRDIHSQYETEHAATPHLPYFLLGHSLGSFLGRTYMMLYDTPFAGCLFTGSTHNSPAFFSSARVIAGLAAFFKGSHCRSESISRITFGKFTPHFGADHSLLPTLGMTRDIFGGMAYMVKQSNINRVLRDIPILFFSGLKDSVNHHGRDIHRAADAYKKAGCKDVTVKLYPEGPHSMLRSDIKEEVWRDIADWMNSKI